jgi:hypothetical protein
MRSLQIYALSLVCVLSLVPDAPAQDTGRRYENPKVLPEDISEDALSEIMLQNLRGLGLRRLAGEGCLFCHVGDLEQPRSEWDWPSDEKPTKRKARVMMAMVQSINDQHLTQLEERIDSTFQVTCYSCHKGRTDPRPLDEVMLAAYEAGGIDSAVSRYRALRERYLGSDAYDFRVNVLSAVATELSTRKAFDDAIALAGLNAEVHPEDAGAAIVRARFVLERTANTEGVEAALVQFDAMEAEVVHPFVLDWLGWRLRRQGREVEGNAALRRNLEKFPNEYVPNESVAFILDDGGDKAGAIRVLEAWLERHPDHARARRLLVNIRGG